MRNILKTILALTIMLTAFHAAGGAALAGYWNRNTPVEVEIVSGREGVLSKFPAESGNRLTRRNYVVAHDREHYSILVRNLSDERIGLVIAVDGRNIISGNKSYLTPEERMYILGPRESGNYEGWRTGRNEVHRFYFTGMNDSYSAYWGDYSAMGVIAVTVFPERRHEKYYRKDGPREEKRPWSNNMAPGGGGPGTGFGEEEWSPSRPVSFEPESQPSYREFIKYEYRETLCRRGIIRCWERRAPENRFWPEHDHDHGYAPHPGRPPWRRW